MKHLLTQVDQDSSIGSGITNHYMIKVIISNMTSDSHAGEYEDGCLLGCNPV
jgi:hypothetical protein